jgi:membrane protease YdiL (CAAX protease family)
VRTRADAWLGPRRPLFARALGLAALAVGLQPVLGLGLGNVWYRMAVAAALLIPVALAAVPVGWRELYRPAWWHLPAALVGTVGLYAAGAVVSGLLMSIRAAASQAGMLYVWIPLAPERLMLPLLLFIILGEEIVWRNAVTLPFAARLGPFWGCLAAGVAFALAHLSLGIPLLLLAALCAGCFWSAMVVVTRSAWPALLCHVAWDLAVMLWWPYVGGS